MFDGLFRFIMPIDRRYKISGIQGSLTENLIQIFIKEFTTFDRFIQKCMQMMLHFLIVKNWGEGGRRQKWKEIRVDLLDLIRDENVGAAAAVGHIEDLDKVFMLAKAHMDKVLYGNEAEQAEAENEWDMWQEGGMGVELPDVCPYAFEKLKSWNKIETVYFPLLFAIMCGLKTKNRKLKPGISHVKR